MGLKRFNYTLLTVGPEPNSHCSCNLSAESHCCPFAVEGPASVLLAMTPVLSEPKCFMFGIVHSQGSISGCDVAFAITQNYLISFFLAQAVLQSGLGVLVLMLSISWTADESDLEGPQPKKRRLCLKAIFAKQQGINYRCQTCQCFLTTYCPFFPAFNPTIRGAG